MHFLSWSILALQQLCQAFCEWCYSCSCVCCQAPWRLHPASESDAALPEWCLPRVPTGQLWQVSLFCGLVQDELFLTIKLVYKLPTQAANYGVEATCSSWLISYKIWFLFLKAKQVFSSNQQDPSCSCLYSTRKLYVETAGYTKHPSRLCSSPLRKTLIFSKVYMWFLYSLSLLQYKHKKKRTSSLCLYWEPKLCVMRRHISGWNLMKQQRKLWLKNPFHIILLRGWRCFFRQHWRKMLKLGVT